MKYRLAILLFCFELIVALPVMAQTKAPAQVQPKAPAAAPAPEPLPVLGVPEGYEYLPHGRRDPFVNPVPKPPPGVAHADKPLEPPRPPGLKGATVEEVTLSGIFISRSEPAMSRAILLVPGLRAPVIASRGDALFDAVIKEIRPDSVVFAKVSPGSKPGTAAGGGEEIKKLRSTAGDKK
jgi:hypothetical protein